MNFVFRLAPILMAAALRPGLCPADKGYAYRQGFGFRQGLWMELCIQAIANLNGCVLAARALSFGQGLCLSAGLWLPPGLMDGIMYSGCRQS